MFDETIKNEDCLSKSSVLFVKFSIYSNPVIRKPKHSREISLKLNGGQQTRISNKGSNTIMIHSQYQLIQHRNWRICHKYVTQLYVIKKKNFRAYKLLFWGQK